MSSASSMSHAAYQLSTPQALTPHRQKVDLSTREIPISPVASIGLRAHQSHRQSQVYTGVKGGVTVMNPQGDAGVVEACSQHGNDGQGPSAASTGLRARQSYRQSQVYTGLAGVSVMSPQVAAGVVRASSQPGNGGQWVEVEKGGRGDDGETEGGKEKGGRGGEVQKWDPGLYQRHCSFVSELGMPVLDLLNPQPGNDLPPSSPAMPNSGSHSHSGPPSTLGVTLHQA